MARVKKWIQKVVKRMKKGALHRQLGIPRSKPIPLTLLRKIKNAKIGSTIVYRGKRIKVTRKLKQRAVFLYNLKKARR